MTEPLYDLPRYYDLAFSWDPGDEVALIQRALDAHVDGGASRLLEPACGTGRLLVPLALHGYELLGYDNSPAMVEYARRRVEQTGLADRVEVAQADMVDASFAEPFDAAYCMINSLAHLLDDAPIVAHLRRTAESLRPGGAYLVQLACVWDDLAEYTPYRWSAERDGLKARVEWTVEREDAEARRSHQRCRLDIEDDGRPIVHDEPFVVRLWRYDDWRRLIEASGAFDLVATYNEWLDPIDLDEPVTGEDGNLCYVLRRR